MSFGPRLVDILAKTGTTGGVPAGVQIAGEVIGLNANKLPAADGADAKGVAIYTGRHPDEPLEVVFTRNAQNGTFYLEGSMDGNSFSRLAFRTLHDDTIVSGVTGLVLGASARVLLKLPHTGQWSRLVAVRCGFVLAADDADAQVVVRYLEGR